MYFTHQHRAGPSDALLHAAGLEEPEPPEDLLGNHPLSRHELLILEAIANGAQSKEITEIIGRSRGTVEFYIRSLFLKLGARSRSHLVAQAFRRGVLTVDGPPHER